MADLSALGGLKEVEMLNLNDGEYADAKVSTFRLPTKGEYILRAPDNFPPAAFSRTQKGSLSIAVDPTIVGPTNEGFQIKFTKISATPFKRDGKTVSQIGDYLRATGVKGAISSEQGLADAVESTANRTYKAQLDWRVYNSSTGFSVEGMEKFPKQADGTHQSWIEDPSDIDPETGKPKKLRANVVVKRYLASE